MVRIFKAGGKLAGLALALGFMTAQAQNDGAKTVETGTFHGKVHSTSGRATIYQEKDGKLVLRLTRFKTSNGPDVHVVLIALKDADDDANFLKNGTDFTFSINDNLTWTRGAHTIKAGIEIRRVVIRRIQSSMVCSGVTKSTGVLMISRTLVSRECRPLRITLRA